MKPGDTRLRPPAWATRILRQTLPPGTRGKSILADLEEEFQEVAQERPRAAGRWYAWEAMKLALHFTFAGFRRDHSVQRYEGNGENGFMASLGQNLHFALRNLRRGPGFAFLTILTMALGIGANVAIFSVVKTVVLDPLPYRDAARLVALFEWNQPRDRRSNVANPGNFTAWREGTEAFASMSAESMQMPATILARGEPEEAMVQYANPDFFQVLGLEAAMGRTFLSSDPALDEGEAVLSHRYWARRFGSDPSVIGTTIQVNGDPAVVVGVLPAVYVAFGEGTDVWASMDVTRGDQTNSGRWLWVVGRLREDATFERARSEIEAVSAALQEEFPDFNSGWTVNPVRLKEHVVGDVRPILWILMGAVGLLLLIASANVANLFLIRATERQKEMAVRTSLGASGKTLVSQLLTESLTVAGLGAALGILLAHLGTRAIATRIPSAFNLPRVESAGVDGGVLLLAVIVTALTGIAFGMIPALQAAGTTPADAIRSEGRGHSRRTGRIRNILVVGEVALSVVLLGGAALLGRSLMTLLAVDPGFQPEHVLVGRVNLSGPAYEDDAPKVAFFEELLDRIAAKPGVISAGGVTFLPMDGLGAGTGYFPLDRPEPTPEDRPAADIRNVAGDYFGAMGIDLLFGRYFDGQDGPEGPQTVVVNRTLADKYWSGDEAIGKPIFISWDSEEPWEIVGVVEDVRLSGLSETPREIIYLNYPKAPYFPFLQVAVRSSGNPGALTSTLRQELRALDPSLPLGNVRVMDDVVSASAAGPRMTAFLFLLFAALALTLAAVGLYGVLAYTVSCRVREIGVRMALGAHPRKVLRMVVGQGGGLALAGLALGLGATLLGGRLLASLLYEIRPTDPAALLGTGLFLLLVALASSALPAFRASRIPPAEALRNE